MRTWSSWVVLLVLLMALLACSADPFGARLSTANAALELWQSSRPDAYQMTFRVECGLCYWSTTKTTVRVERDSELAQNATSPSEMTVDVLFDAIYQWLNGGPLERYEAMFDAEFGYPTFISIDGDVETADDEWVFSLESFETVDSK